MKLKIKKLRQSPSLKSGQKRRNNVNTDISAFSNTLIIFPSVGHALIIAITLPVSTCKVERSFRTALCEG